MSEETTNQTTETVKEINQTGLTEDEQAELETLQETETEHLTEDNKNRMAELLVKGAGDNGSQETTETNEVKDNDNAEEDTVETVETEEVKPEDDVEFDTVIPAGEFENWDNAKVYRIYTVETVTVLQEANRLWGTLKSELTNGLGSKAKCFVLDFSGTIKAGDKVEVPEHATIRQSHRKIDPEEKKRLEREGKIVRESTFDWLHI